MTHSKLLSGRSGRQCPSHLPNKQNHPLEIAASVVSMTELCFVCLTVTHTVPIVLTTLLHARFDLTQLFFVLAKEEGFASAKFEFTFAKGERGTYQIN
jgi:hypothetical protein